MRGMSTSALVPFTSSEVRERAKTIVEEMMLAVEEFPNARRVDTSASRQLG